MSDIKLPLAFSLVGHAIGVALLVLLLKTVPPLPQPIAKGGIQVMFEPALPKTETAPLRAPPMARDIPPPVAKAAPEPQAETVPPAPAPAAVTETQEVAREPPPPPKPVAKKPPKPAPRRQEMPQPTQAYVPPQTPTTQAPAAVVAPQQTAAATTRVPAPVPSPQASAGYRALLSAWLESHKRYPESARQRGEEGHAVLRFLVDRSGRVLDFAVMSSSGYPDLDQSLEQMMRGATLPPFPADMPQPRMEVSVTIRFSLRQ